MMTSSPGRYPPSSAPGGTPRSTMQSDLEIDPLNFNDVHGLGGSRRNANGTAEGGNEGDGEPTDENQRRIKRLATGFDPSTIPRVVDKTGLKVVESFTTFLETFVVDKDGVSLDAPTPMTPATPATPPTPGTPGTVIGGTDIEDPHYYINQIKHLKSYKLSTVHINFRDIPKGGPLEDAIKNQFYRFLPYLRRSVANLVKKYQPDYYYLQAPDASGVAAGVTQTSLHTRDFHVAFYNLPIVSSIRELRMHKVGQLISISGTVTRTSEVRPELVMGTFRCMACNTMVYDIEQQFKYTEPIMCQNSQCNNRKDWQLNIEQSKFDDWQKVRIQENANEIPTGSMPRSLDVILRAETVEKAKAGDKCTFTGTFIVVPDVSQLGIPGVNAEMMRENRGGRTDGGVASQGVTGLKALGVRDLTYKTAFLACAVKNMEDRGRGADVRAELSDDFEEAQNQYLSALTRAEMEELLHMMSSGDIYRDLVSSIAPTVYGHEIVKKGILLQLLGGVHKQTPDGIHLRGDINVCIVGDPSTSKSQFLKYVCGFLPRAVYTSGKASSAAGLTAAVVKDEETGEFTIEAGALMLADNGICAIDEFDKMDVADQVAIHEAMEQQTISIAKAGIQATLNARTSILAAANPIGGRYNRKQSLRQNVAMSAPIMSRFDLFFVVLDECNENVDLHIARHIVNVHRFREASLVPKYSTESLQRYIGLARTYKPMLTPEASRTLVQKYRDLRQSEGGPGKSNYRITVRQLESMIRLSEAIARAMCQKEITHHNVLEAYNLLRQSIIHVEQDDINFDDEEEAVDPHDPDAMDADDAADIAALDAAESSLNNTGGEASSVPAPGSGKLRITYNRYMEIMNMIVLHLSDMERTSGTGVDKEELIEWYLEQKEEQLESIDELELEREIVTKALTKLAKDSYLLEIRGDVREGLADSSAEESASDKIFYLVHPQVDLSDLSSSVPMP